MKKNSWAIPSGFTSTSDPADFDYYLRDLQKDHSGFEELSVILKQEIGINLPRTDKNLSLMSSRLNKVMAHHGAKSFTAFAKMVRRDPEALGIFIEQMTTNTTHFLRERSHFDMIGRCVRDLMSQPDWNRELRIWCSASSSGQEPYTILIMLSEEFGWPLPFHLRFLATDVSMEMLTEAAQAIYTEKEMEALPVAFVEKYFKPLSRIMKATTGTDYVLRKEFQGLITFAPFNLLTENYPFKRAFDIIFCRNVLIYFDRQTADAIIDKVLKKLKGGGYLFLGHSESGMMRHPTIDVIGHSAYKKKV